MSNKFITSKSVMKNVLNIIEKLAIKNEPKVLGRWNIDSCDSKTSRKVDLSNEDHCGPCGQYSINKLDGEGGDGLNNNNNNNSGLKK